jgi:hypothetical protein
MDLAVVFTGAYNDSSIDRGEREVFNAIVATVQR